MLHTIPYCSTVPVLLVLVSTASRSTNEDAAIGIGRWAIALGNLEPPTLSSSRLAYLLALVRAASGHGLFPGTLSAQLVSLIGGFGTSGPRAATYLPDWFEIRLHPISVGKSMTMQDVV
ncbi:hypothetical protein BDV28DRAFT_35105 [Aspergillus coremiiformis]|uniref:Secreted protein n=1 Tax=Aspergillus coremiiformis TaxID=138285 RepID=A0A5N6YYZ9_9EURO|nr:hypothetical protein BDV28DRAFT_35105 [Aspergillus coremiiformis]